eukprot:Skav219365  [mRNA]  locus=scaffold76:600161:600784:- [translate_table: standard]
MSAEICNFGANAKYFLDLLGRLLRKDLDEVNLSESFTRLGGDSVLAIRLSAKLRDQGLQLSSARLLGQVSIQSLAIELENEAIQLFGQAPVEGEVPMAPMQRRFWDLKLVHAEHYNQSVMLVPQFPRTLDAEVLRKGLVKLAEHHDMLRASDQAQQVTGGDRPYDPSMIHTVWGRAQRVKSTSETPLRAELLVATFHSSTFPLWYLG